MTASVSRGLPVDVAFKQAVAHHQAGRLQEAEGLYRAILQVQPYHPDANHNLGVLAGQVGQHAAGLPYLKAALAVNPAHGQYVLSYAEALLATGQAGEALKILDGALQRGLDTPAAQALRTKAAAAALGAPGTGEGPTSVEMNQLVALFNAGRHPELESHARLLVERHPDSGFAWKALGTSLQIQGKDALSALQKATELLPNDAEAHSNLGASLQAIGELDDAVASYRRALEINPDYAEAHSNLGNALRDLGHPDDAVACYRRALAIKPDYADAHSNLGDALRELGRLDEAVASCRRALEINPDLAEGHVSLGAVLHDFGQLDGAVASCRRALEIKPDYVEAHVNLGTALQDFGRLADAEASYRRALEIKPDCAEAYSNLLFLYGYYASIDADKYLAQARNWEQACLPAQDRRAARLRVFQRSPLAGRRLRVGYVSGDYRQHSVSYFVEQLFTHHDRGRIELFAYSTHGQRDAVAERLQALAERWVPVMGLSDSAIRERIEADGIDVLVDLSGHTRHNRMGVFARRAAPVQAHYLGYFASTGLAEMDYWIGDEVLTPAGMDGDFCEQVWRLPRVWVSYDGKAEAPVPDWRPSRDRAVCLGSFNNLGKLTPATLALWAKVLHALPEGKLLLKNKHLRDIDNRRRILDAMSGHGISPNRIELQDSSATPDWPAHMAYYDRLDIALDPVGGVGGGTTTCDALWMGVPVIAREGDRMASRMTASMLDAIGRSEWIARSEAEYIDKVVALSRDVEQRKVPRSGQRKRMAASPLCDARGLALSLENAYFEMFERWLDKKNSRTTPATK